MRDACCVVAVNAGPAPQRNAAALDAGAAFVTQLRHSCCNFDAYVQQPHSLHFTLRHPSTSNLIPCVSLVLLVVIVPF